MYTRDGAFQLDRDGNLVNALGYDLEPAIQIPVEAISVTILRDGTVSVLEAGQTNPTNAGQIDLTRFTNPAGLRALGNNMYAATEASGDPETGTADQTGFGAVTQGFLESSNVNMAEELVHMILAQRAFEVNSRVLQAGDEMLRTATSS